MELNAVQQRQIDAAREALAAGHGYDVASLGRRVGALEWWLKDVLALVDELTATKVRAADLDLPPHPSAYMSPQRWALYCTVVDTLAARRGLPSRRPALRAI